MGSKQRKSTRPIRDGLPQVAVVGAGLSGLICARTLADRGVPVTVFDKSRGVGGRMATRRSEQDLTFDHGAQYFTVKDQQFERHVRSWQLDGVVENWQGAIGVLRNGHLNPCKNETKRLVGRPTMNAVCKHISTQLDVRLLCEISSLRSNGGRWCLVDKGGMELGAFDIVIVSAPGPQSARLLEPVPDLAESAGLVRMQPCWAVMATFDSPIPAVFDGAFVHESALSWIARNSSKPARSCSQDCWVLHGSADWSTDQVEATSEEVEAHLLEEFWKVTRLRTVSPQSAQAHRWRYALPIQSLEQQSLFDPVSRLGACGDWCWDPGVEGAFLSGIDAAENVLHSAALAP